MSPPAPVVIASGADTARGIVGILLAAGRSLRFGGDKLTSPLADGTPMALTCARKLRKAVGNVLVAVRPEQHMLQQLLAQNDLPFVLCPQADLGVGYSLASAIAASADAQAWLVSLADLPFIDDDVYQRVISAYLDHGGIVRPTYQGQPGHPVMFDHGFKSELLSCRDAQGARALQDRHSRQVTLIPVDHNGCTRDVDVPEDSINR